MQNFNMQQGGIIIAVIGTLLMHFGFSDMCSSQVIQFAPVAIGGIMSYIHQVRSGHITLGGFKKV